jgi:hypothetical protein
MKKIVFLLVLTIKSSLLFAQSISNSVIGSAANNFQNSSIIISYTVGQNFNSTFYNNNMLTQGYQQPASIDTGVYVYLTAFIEGFYLGKNTMQSLFNDATIKTTNIIADVIKVELHNSTAPYALAFTNNALINTDGTAKVLFPASAISNSYYLVVKHRNSIETWSASPVTISNHTIYNFTTAASQAYGANLSNLGKGVFGIYSGDINQDGSIDFNDYPELDIASHLGVLGYDVNDLNGDASVDFNDFPILDVNSNYGIIAIRP